MKTTKFFEFYVVFMSRIITSCFRAETSLNKSIGSIRRKSYTSLFEKQFAEFSPIENKISKIVSVE